MKRLLKLAISSALWCWDALVALLAGLAGREPRPTSVVLYYHAIEPGQRARFARQMDEVIRLTLPVPAGLTSLPHGARHYCVVTFDDGFVSVLDNALPELEARRIPAAIFVPTGNLGGRPGWIKAPSSRARGEVIMSADQLATLSWREFVTIGSHSVSHPNFQRLQPAQARWELRQSKADLERILGRKVNLFSFPHGACDATTIEMAKAAGYERIFTIDPAADFAAREGFVFGRVLAGPGDWPIEFRLKLLGAYRWLAKRRHPLSNPSTLATRPEQALASSLESR